MNYDNGHPVPGGYRQPSYPPPTPVAQQAPYEPPHTSYSSNTDPYYSVYPSSIPAKKKNTRASQVGTLPTFAPEALAYLVNDIELTIGEHRLAINAAN
jgi:hypothetical protein